MKQPGPFVQELRLDGVRLSQNAGEIPALVAEIFSEGLPFVSLSLMVPDRDGGMDISRVDGRCYAIVGGEDSQERGGFCFTYFDETLDDQIVEDVEGIRAFATLEDPLAVQAIALHYVSFGELYPEHTWHVSRIGNGQPKAEIPADEIYGHDGWKEGGFDDFLLLLPRGVSLS
ncbi:hypothetical protein [Prosthecobacter sp.]|uniref:hypothetical protein n=1 Tax=Prosthecobacter sp. TaxID=1965333 RepID=UPI00378438F9